MRSFISLVWLAVACFASGDAFAADPAERLNSLEKAVQEQQRRIEEQQKEIEQLRHELEEKSPSKQHFGRTEAAHGEGHGGEEHSAAGGTGPAVTDGLMKNMNISLVIDTYAYVSSFNDTELEARGIPGYTTSGYDQREGFNLRAAELILLAPVGSLFDLYANIPFDEEGVEIEEAYAVTTALPGGVQIKAGKFKSSFSRINAQHPHVWDFFDIPLPYRAFLGDEGLGGEKGVQISWLSPFPVRIGIELLQGENDRLFGADARSGPHALSFFTKTLFRPTERSTVYAGPGLLFGKARNGNVSPDAEFDGTSTLAGFETVWHWEPSDERGITVQSEYLFLVQNGNLGGADAMDRMRRRQDGFYIQALCRQGRLRIGARYDMLALFADTFELADVRQEFGATPWRASGSIEWNFSEATRLRLQYNHDRSGRDGRNNEEGILQFVFGLGAHTPHSGLLL